MCELVCTVTELSQNMFPKRPKRGEDDDDIQKFQEEFLRDASRAPAAKVIRVGPKNLPVSQPHPAPVTESSSVTKEQTKPANDAVEDIPEDPAENVLLARVVEKSNVSAFLSSVSPQASASSGFPEVPKLSAEILKGTTTAHTTKKKSLFLQQAEAKRLAKKRAAAATCSAATTSSAAGHPSESVPVVSGESAVSEDKAIDVSTMMSEIAEENKNKIAQMTAEEILAEQQELTQTLDPRLLQMFKNRKCKVVKGSTASQSAASQSAASQSAACQSAACQSAASQSAASQSAASQSSQSDNDVEMAEAEDKGSAFVKDTITPLKSEDLPFQPDGSWLHMDQMEHHKLQWLKPLDEQKKQKDGKSEKLSARFDFNGKLISPDLDIGTRSGLHHHGEEPHSAGYTLEELYVLVRSLNTSQKTLALSTIASVLRKAKRGDYLYLLNNSICKALMEADIILLLRYALDERSDLVIAAAVNAWHALLCPSSDMEALNGLSSSLYGHFVPEMVADDPPPPETDEEEMERQEEQYIEVLKRDVISGLLLMDFLPRLRYILEVVRPQQIVCSQILDLICRMVMTSAEVAYKVYCTPRLVHVVLELFLPMSFTADTTDVECGHGKALVEAMRSIRYLCASGRNMSVELMTKYSLMDRIVRYISSDDKSEFGADYEKLMVESLLTWRSLLLYGLALDHYHVLRAGLVTRLQQETDPLIASSLIGLLSAFLSAAATEQPAKTVRFSDLSLGDRMSAPSSSLEWTHVAGLIDSVYGLSLNKLTAFIDSYADQHSTFDLDGLISSLDFVCLYVSHSRVQPVNLECTVGPEAIAADLAKLVGQLLVSTAFNTLLSHIRKSSILMRELGYIASETTTNLPSLHTVAKPANTEEMDDETKAIADVRQFLLLQSLVKLLACVLKVCPANIQPLCTRLLEHTQVFTYITKFSHSSLANSDNYLSLVECSTLIDLCQLAAAVPTSRTKEYHRCSLSLVSKCTTSILTDLHNLLSYSVFDPTMFRSCEVKVSEDDVIFSECLKSLPSIANTYTTISLPQGGQLDKSRNLKSRNTARTTSLHIKHNTRDLLPTDWPFMPIIHLYQTSNSRDAEAKMPPDTCLLLKNSLQFVYMLEKCHPDVIRSIGAHAKIARIMCSFLLDNDLFLEADMQPLLLTLLTLYCQHIRRIQFDQPIPGLFSFTDLYSAFVEQFEAVSFGNNVFSQYLLLPMMQQQKEEYKKLVWVEHALTLRSVFLKPQELVFPVEELLYPEETNPTIVMYMCRHLLTGTVTLRRNHLMYIVALHHVNRFMFTTDGTSSDIKQGLLKSAQQCTVEPLKEHLVFYKEYQHPSDTKGDGIICYSKLPASRCQTLKSVQLS